MINGRYKYESVRQKVKANEYNHLIILGNGFDLKCGLHTTYDAFFDERFGIEEACEVNKRDCKIFCVRMNDSLTLFFNIRKRNS